jgi:hypothetical protein
MQLYQNSKKKCGEITGMKMGRMIDKAVSVAVQKQNLFSKIKPVTIAEKAAHNVLKTLRLKHDFVPVDTQRCVTMLKHCVSPVLDLIGVTKKGTPVIVEIKCGSTAGCNRRTGNSGFLKEPLEHTPDTWRNRSFAQLAIQRAAVLCTAKRIGKESEFKKIISLLACVDTYGHIKVFKLPAKFNSVDKWSVY